MNKIRLFIAIPVPGNIKGSIAGLLRNVKPMFKNMSDVRFISEEKLYFTVTFLGYQEEAIVPVIKKSLEESILTFNKREIKDKLDIEFKKLVYGPPGRTPRMIWLTATKETSERLGVLKVLLENMLEKNKVWWRRESRPLQIHLTLARFLPTARKEVPFIDPVRSRPSDITSERATTASGRSASNGVDKDYSWSYQVEKLNLMKSILKPGGAIYETLFTSSSLHLPHPFG